MRKYSVGGRIGDSLASVSKLGLTAENEVSHVPFEQGVWASYVQIAVYVNIYDFPFSDEDRT